MIGIYKITSPSGRVYIGQSVNIENRWMHYRTPNNSLGQTRLNASFSKHGVTSHVFEVICECSIGELNALERSYQEQYNVLSSKGLNCKLTSTEDKKSIASEETRYKISKALTGRRLSKEHAMKGALSRVGHVMKEESKIKAVEARRRNGSYTFSEEHKKKLSIAAKNRKR